MKVAVVILVVVLAYACVYSLMCIIAPKVVLKSGLQASIGKTIDDAQNDGYLRGFTVVMRNLGALALSGIIADLFILLVAFRKAQKWAWVALLIAGCVGWLSGLIINIVIGDMTNMSLHIIGTVIFLVGLFLPIKAFFAGAPKQVEEPAQEA